MISFMIGFIGTLVALSPSVYYAVKSHKEYERGHRDGWGQLELQFKNMLDKRSHVVEHSGRTFVVIDTTTGKDADILKFTRKKQ